MSELLPISAEYEQAVLALNNAHSIELSWLEADQLAALLRQACYARRIGAVDAFMLALDEHAAYDSPNYQWFLRRYTRFVYVDRFVVSAAARGQGHARALYAGVFQFAVQTGRHWVMCEVNAEPPNPASEHLHTALGFAAIGEAAIHDGRKTVRYYAKRLG
ncbi:MAG TPA: GNAT family N-acetyltransferase [Acetobacteraceae bacterium]|jgi:hypothetical protein